MGRNVVTQPRATNSIVNGTTSGTPAGIDLTALTATNSVLASLSGACTANTLKTLLNITSAGGELTFLALKTLDATARTLRIKITVDSVVIYDKTTSSISTSGYGLPVIGYSLTAASNNMVKAGSIYWNNSLLIEFATSVTEADKQTAYWGYTTWA